MKKKKVITGYTGIYADKNKLFKFVIPCGSDSTLPEELEADTFAIYRKKLSNTKKIKITIEDCE